MNFSSIRHANQIFNFLNNLIHYLQTAVCAVYIPHVEVFGFGILMTGTRALFGSIWILILRDYHFLKFIELESFLFIAVSESYLLKFCHVAEV